MLQAYSLDAVVASNAVVPFNNISLKKGCTVTHSAVGTFELNRCGIYMISVNSSALASSTIQLFKDGVALAQAQSVGLNPCFTTLVQVPFNNNCDPCTSPVVIEVRNVGDAEATLDANIVITKVV